LYSVTPDTGTSAGTRMTLMVAGVGTGMNVKNIDIVDEWNTNICKVDVEIPEYGVVYCWSYNKGRSDYFDVYFKYNDDKYGCANTDTT
jgi:hypothetical protein